jgi:hypothetical protein
MCWIDDLQYNPLYLAVSILLYYAPCLLHFTKYTYRLVYYSQPVLHHILTQQNTNKLPSLIHDHPPLPHHPLLTPNHQKMESLKQSKNTMEAPNPAVLHITSVTFVNGYDVVIRLVVSKFSVDITVNKLCAIASTCWICAIIKSSHYSAGLFAKCITFIKSWCKYESKKYVGVTIFGSKNKMLTSYMLTLMTTAVFSVKNPTSLYDFLNSFFDYYSNFDWGNNVLTIFGAVPQIQFYAEGSQRPDSCYDFSDGKNEDVVGFHKILEPFKNFGAKTGSVRRWLSGACCILDPMDSNNNVGKVSFCIFFFIDFHTSLLQD